MPNDIPVHPSLAAMGELPLIQLILSNRLRSSNLVNVSGFPRNPIIDGPFDLRSLPGRPAGDVDLLVWGNRYPHQAVAIEVKRVKAIERADEDGQINKLHELLDGAKQAYRLLKLGFWLVYLWPILIVDSRARNQRAHTYAGLCESHHQTWKLALDRVISETDSRIGLITHEFVQSEDTEPTRLGSSSSMHFIRPGVPQQQSTDITDWTAGIDRARSLRISVLGDCSLRPRLS